MPPHKENRPAALSDRAFAFDHEHAGFPDGMGHVLVPCPGDEHVACAQLHDLFRAVADRLSLAFTELGVEYVVEAVFAREASDRAHVICLDCCKISMGFKQILDIARNLFFDGAIISSTLGVSPGNNSAVSL